MCSLHMCSHPCNIAGSPGRAEWEVFMAKSPVLTQPNTVALLRAAPGAGSHPNPIGSFWRCCLFVPWQVQRTLQTPANLRAPDITAWVPEGWSQSSLCLNRVWVAKMLFRLEGVNLKKKKINFLPWKNFTLPFLLPAASRGPGDSRHNSSRWFWWCKAQGDRSQELLRRWSQKGADASGVPQPHPARVWRFLLQPALSPRPPQRFIPRACSASDPKSAEISLCTTHHESCTRPRAMQAAI